MIVTLFGILLMDVQILSDSRGQGRLIVLCAETYSQTRAPLRIQGVWKVLVVPPVRAPLPLTHDLSVISVLHGSGAWLIHCGNR